MPKFDSNNVVHNEEISKDLFNRIGKWNSCEYISRHDRVPGTGYTNYIYHVHCDEKNYRVEVGYFWGGPHSGFFSSIVNIEDLDEYDKKRKEFGRRAARIAKVTETTYEIVTSIENLENKETDDCISILNKFVNAINAYNPKDFFEYQYIYRKLSSNSKYEISEAIELVIPEDVLKNFLYYGCAKSYDIANYIKSKLVNNLIRK